jgi:GntR family transcriptional repressor for pyruvate dehydrogenase complex
MTSYINLSDLAPHEAALALVMAEQVDPLGARVAVRALAEQGIELSEASVSRLLSRLDALGVSRPIGRKGRVLTPQGRTAVEAQEYQLRRNRNFSRALELRSATEVLDWLRARRAIESEAAYLAAQRIDDELLAAIESAVVSHEAAATIGRLDFRTVGMGFHSLLASAARSPVFTALIESLISPSAEAVESALDLITANRGTIGESADDHRQLLNALKNGDAEAARACMDQHMRRLEHEVEAFVERSGDAGFASALSLLTTMREAGRLP